MRPLAFHPLAILILLCGLDGIASAARPGDPDPTFGLGGAVRVPMASGALNDVIALPDGSLLVGGTGDREGDGTTKFVLARFDANGALVPDFGNGGLVETRLPLADTATVRRLALDPDGRIVAAGISETLLATGETSSVLKMTRYFPDGRLDRDFGTDGVRRARLALDVAGIVVGDDHGITFIGRDTNLIAGFLRVGSGFGSFELFERSDGTDVVPHQGGVVMGGTLDGDFLLMRLVNGVAAFDSQFGDGGTVRTSIGSGSDRLRKLLVLPDDGIVAIGATVVGPGDSDIAIARYTAGGALDPTFGNGGIVVTSLGERADDVLDAVLAPDGTMVVAGRTCSPAPPCHGFLARLRADGSLDPDFGENGVVAAAGIVVAGIAMPDDGHVVVVQHVPDALIVSRFVVATCGNGRVEAGEECDGSECCTPTCTLDPDDTPCGDDGSACTADLCRSGACTHVVPAQAGCVAATSSTFARVRNDVAGDRLRWSWQTTAPVDPASFGDPIEATDLTVCIVDPVRESDPPLVELTVPAAGICNGAPCWKATPRGFRFKDAAAAQDGVTVVRLASGADGGRINVKAKNVRGVSDLPAPLRVRLVRHDAPRCFEADLAPVPGAALRFQSR